MGIGGDIKTGKFLRIVRRIASRSAIEINPGGKHNYKVECILTGKSYPLPANHPVINKHIVRSFGKWLEENEVCTYEEFVRYCKSL